MSRLYMLKALKGLELKAYCSLRSLRVYLGRYPIKQKLIDLVEVKES
jgi:hypothetical protein